MEYRVEQLAAASRVSVDTVRFYQARGLLPPPRREGRVAFYGDEHAARIERIKTLQANGVTLAAIGRLLTGDLDAADEALVTALGAGGTGGEGVVFDSPPPSVLGGRPEHPRFAGSARQAHSGSSQPSDVWEQPAEELLDVEELAARTGVPLALLQALEREGLLVPRLVEGLPRYTSADVEAAACGLRLLEQGLPLSEVLALARRHHQAVREVASEAVALFDAHVRQPLRKAGLSDEEAARRLVAAFEVVLPATLRLVSHHFRRVLLAVAQDRIQHGHQPRRPGHQAQADSQSLHEAGPTAWPTPEAPRGGKA